VDFALELRKRVTPVWAFFTLAALYAVLAWTGQGWAGLLLVVLVPLGAVLGFRLVRDLTRQTIWRLRNRLIVTYVFIAVVPILLIVALAAVGTWIVVGQVAVYLINAQLQRRAASLELPARLISEAKPADRAAVIAQLTPALEKVTPGLMVLVTGGETLRWPAGSLLEAPPPALASYTGYIFRKGHHYCAAIASSGATRVILAAPINGALLAALVPNLGVINLFGVRDELAAEPAQQDIAGTVPPAYDAFDFQTTWMTRPTFALWNRPGQTASAVLIVQTRPSAVLNAVFSEGADEALTTQVAFVVIALLLLGVELAALVIGVSLTRTITNSVHGLYEGTERIAQGDFAWRIPVKGKDQLAELGNSFNHMTARLENLVVVAKEKERLQSEIEIASGVQTQLCPRAAPEPRTLELIGECHPARMCSGDYYDYLRLPDGNLALAIGDVAGKGISAALLMASIQSIVRTQLADGAMARLSTATLVAQLNRQLYAHTSSEKFATFFFGLYHEETRTLTYTNAGHVQPIILRKEPLRDGGTQLLEVTGTIVGAFPAIRYEEQSVRLDAGDLLVAYTDGITEPENAYGEEFGADRLAEIVRRNQSCESREIVVKIMDAVRQWSSADELPDDMTILLARSLA
jgi:sigma-B regulation protein RsbU (phosphoserine phosphatase)